MKNYLKYYWLEKDFFPEIYNFFHKEKCLTSEHFFSIITWKSIRPRERIKRGLLVNGESLDEAVRVLTKRIYEAPSKEEKLGVLIGDGNNKKQVGFRLAMASAILAVLYPRDFTVYDFRVRSQLVNPKNDTLEYPDITGYKKVIKKYLYEYIPQVLQEGRSLAKNPKLSLRDCDRFLWAKDWHEDLQEFICNRKT